MSWDPSFDDPSLESAMASIPEEALYVSDPYMDRLMNDLYYRVARHDQMKREAIRRKNALFRLQTNQRRRAEIQALIEKERIIAEKKRKWWLRTRYKGRQEYEDERIARIAREKKEEEEKRKAVQEYSSRNNDPTYRRWTDDKGWIRNKVWRDDYGWEVPVTFIQ